MFPAYRRATANLAVVRPNCGLTWPLLAGIGKVESDHASGGRVDVAGTTRGKILGPVLNGRGGNGRITDSDKGRYDGDLTWDRAVGPMQIIPQVWDEFGADGNGDGFRNPNNVYDAVTTVAVVLCSEGDDLKRPRDLVASLLRYQHSKDFVATVLKWMRVYSKNAVLVPNAKGSLSVPKSTGNAERKVDPRAVPDIPDDTTPTRRRPQPTPKRRGRPRRSASRRCRTRSTRRQTPTHQPTRPTQTADAKDADQDADHDADADAHADPDSDPHTDRRRRTPRPVRRARRQRPTTPTCTPGGGSHG